MDLDFAFEFELRDTAQVLTQDFFFDFELMVVGGVLVVASAAAGEVWARRLSAVRGRLDYFAGLGAGEAGFFLGERGFDLFSGQDEGNEDGFAAAPVFIGRSGGKTSESVASVDELFDG
jgi:hypothetical protein